MTDYKDYSLQKLEEWIHDALSCEEASPQEIYSTIKNAVQDDHNYHKKYSQRCFELLELLNGYRPVNLDDDWEKDSSSKETKQNPNNYIYDPAGNNVYNLVNESAKKWILPVEVDGASDEYYLQLPNDLLNTLGWKEGDTLEYTDNGDGSFTLKKESRTKPHDEMIALGWTMTDDGFWIKE